MLKKAAFGTVGLLLLATPLISSAGTIEDLQAQIQALLAQVAALTGQRGNSTTSNTQCVNLTSSMGSDDTDADTSGNVTRLQTFLATNSSIYPEGRITGYFGPATIRAVQRWQKAHNIVSSGNPDSTGYGYVGRKTRAAMGCGSSSGQNTSGTGTSGGTQSSASPSTPSTSPTLSASPTSGTVPLTVN